MGIFISVSKTIECVVIALFFAVMLCAAAYRQAGVLQSCGYSGGKYFGWLKKKGNLAYERFALLALLCALSSAVNSLPAAPFTSACCAAIFMALSCLLFMVLSTSYKNLFMFI